MEEAAAQRKKAAFKAQKKMAEKHAAKVLLME